MSIIFRALAALSLMIIIGCGSSSAPAQNSVAAVASQQPTSTTPSDDHGSTVATATSCSFTGNLVRQLGQIEVSTDTDMFAVGLLSGHIYAVETVSAGDTHLEIMDTRGVTLDKDDDNGNNGLDSFLSINATVDGTHFVAVTGSRSDRPKYEMFVRDLTPPASAPTPPPPAAPAPSLPLTATVRSFVSQGPGQSGPYRNVPGNAWCASLLVRFEANEPNVEIVEALADFTTSVGQARMYLASYINGGYVGTAYASGPQNGGAVQRLEIPAGATSIASLPNVGDYAEGEISILLPAWDNQAFVTNILDLTLRVNGQTMVMTLALSETVLIEALSDIGQFPTQASTLASITSGTPSAVVIEVESRELTGVHTTDITEMTVESLNPLVDCDLQLVDASGLVLASRVMAGLSWQGRPMWTFSLPLGALRLGPNGRVLWRIQANLTTNTQAFLSFIVTGMSFENDNGQGLSTGGIMTTAFVHIPFLTQVGADLSTLLAVNPPNNGTFAGVVGMKVWVVNSGNQTETLTAAAGTAFTNDATLSGAIWTEVNGQIRPASLSFNGPLALDVAPTPIAPGQAVMLNIWIDIRNGSANDLFRFTLDALTFSKGIRHLPMQGPMLIHG